MAVNWDRELRNLGVDSDIAIAKRLGVSKERVRQVRAKLNIPRAKRRPIRSARGEKSVDIEKHLKSVPLSDRECQTITNARLAIGWSQGELADRIGSSYVFLNSIETGRKSPSPAYLGRLCKALGLEWRFRYWLEIAPKKGGRSL